MNDIEQNFMDLMGIKPEQKAPDKDFQQILDESMGDYSDYDDDSVGSANCTRPEINKLIDEYSAKNGLDADFVKAVIKQESGFNPKAKSGCGAMGLMQLMPGTAKGLGVVNPFNAEDNIKGGTKMLSNLLRTYGGRKDLALAAYNAGGGAVKKYGGIPPYAETQRYVKNILSMYGKMKGGA
ncbi:lytic transglycosylase domain-containing protein [bacterium]|nr:lytic transglycosylase domain-containing protein [bacterium]